MNIESNLQNIKTEEISKKSSENQEEKMPEYLKAVDRYAKILVNESVENIEDLDIVDRDQREEIEDLQKMLGELEQQLGISAEETERKINEAKKKYLH